MQAMRAAAADGQTCTKTCHHHSDAIQMENTLTDVNDVSDVHFFIVVTHAVIFCPVRGGAGLLRLHR